MRIQCPSCETVYDVPDHTAAGRKVQCAQCGLKWAPVPPPVPSPVPSPVPHPPPTAVPGPPSPPLPAVPSFPTADPAFVISPWPDTEPAAPGSWARRQRPWGLIAAWAGSVALLAAMAALAVVERGAVMDAWPPSTRLFTMLGLH